MSTRITLLYGHRIADNVYEDHTSLRGQDSRYVMSTRITLLYGDRIADNVYEDHTSLRAQDSK
jgi:hypothetical protein